GSPERVRNQRDAGGAGAILLRSEVPAKRGGDAERGEEARFDAGASGTGGMVAGPVAFGDAGPGCHLGERSGLAPKVEVRGGGEEVVFEPGDANAERRETVGGGIGERTKEDAVDDAEDGGGGADAEGEDRGHGQRKGPIRAEGPKSGHFFSKGWTPSMGG